MEIVRKQVLIVSSYFTTCPGWLRRICGGGCCAGFVEVVVQRICGGGSAGYVLEEIKIKLRPAKAGTEAELGKYNKSLNAVFL